MIYSNLNDIKVSKLGFGCMRFPVLEDKSIDQEQVEKMVDIAIENGVNYFDTAWPYHDGLSEVAIGKALSKYPRDSYYLADKYPGHQIVEEYNPEKIFNRQLEKCNVDYFDFYLLHNVYENDIQVYEDPKWGIIDYFVKQKQEGKIKHLGFSSHAKPECLKQFIERHPNTFDFVQIQLNYVDWTLQDAKEKVEILNSFNLPIIVMEPIRGGSLANFDEKINNKLKQYRPNNSIASWALNYLLNINGILTILSGMSNIDQMKDNIKTFNENKPLNEEETKVIYEVADTFMNRVPCTKCRYCCAGCPVQIDIPALIETYNDLKIKKAVNPIMYLDSIDKSKWPHACIQCGQCSSICPQGIDVPSIMTSLSETIDSMPSWADISKQRAEASKRNGD